MKKLKFIALIIIFGIMGLAGCNKPDRKEIVFPKDELLTEYVSATNKDMEIVEEGEDFKTAFFYRGDSKIYSQIYVPDGKGPFPVVVISGGMGVSLTSNHLLANELSANGIVAISYDPYGAVNQSQSDGQFTDFSVLTQASDIEAIISAISKEDYIDTNKIFLWGHSFGGMSSAYVGLKNPDLIKGMILVEPSFQMNAQAHELYPNYEDIPDIITSPFYCGGPFYRDPWRFDIYELMPDYNGKVLLYAGTNTNSIGGSMPELVTKADKLLPSCDLIFVEGADHSFAGSAINQVTKETIEFVKGK